MQQVPITAAEPITEPSELGKLQRKYAFRTSVPSMGHLHGDKFPGGEVIISPFTVGEEKILAAGGSRDRMEVLDEVLRRCIVRMPIAYEELLVNDMLFLLLQVRTTTYGGEYQFNLKCGDCGLNYKRSVDLTTDLQVTALSSADQPEPYEVALPCSGDTVRWRHLRIRDEGEIRRYAKQAYAKTVQAGDPAYVYRISKHLVEIGGKPVNSLEALDYTEGLQSLDSLTIQKSMRANSFGVDLSIHTICNRCGAEAEERLRLDREFFRPDLA